ncbi:MAG TPA: hypothetical protein VJ767_07350 [Nitrososphaeraceae archaeon]|nr:hypothetical protein [Nitrososphaeraceae archaeon]
MQKGTWDCNLLHGYNWIQIFDSIIYDDVTIYNNNFALKEMNPIY